MATVHEGEADDVHGSSPSTAQAPVFSKAHVRKDFFTPASEFDDLMNLKGFKSAGASSNPKSLKKSSLVFPTRAYPSRTRSVVKDTHPLTFIQKGK